MKFYSLLASVSFASVGFLSSTTNAGPAHEFVAVIENINESDFPLLSAEVGVEEIFDDKRWEDKIVHYKIQIADFYRINPSGKRVFLRSFNANEFSLIPKWRSSLKIPQNQIITSIRIANATRVEKVEVKFKNKRILEAKEALLRLEKDQNLMNKVLNVCEGVKLDLGNNGGVLDLKLGGLFKELSLEDVTRIGCVGDCPVDSDYVTTEKAVVKFKCEKPIYSVRK